MRVQKLLVVGLMIAVGFVGGVAQASTLTIHDIQSNTSDGDASIYNGQIHDVTGGIVTHIWQGWKPRAYLQDPAYPQWGGIIVKDFEGGAFANNVNVGDWVSLNDILIEEYRGTTHLQYDTGSAPDVSFTVVSTGNPVPAPRVLSASDLVVPVNHSASEPYESMIVSLHYVRVGQKGLGKAGDNYELMQGGVIAWGTDYQNVDAGAPYDPNIVTGNVLVSVTGVVEQYTKSPTWDYYQVCTRSAGDIVAAAEGIPTVSEWGIIVLALLLAVTAKVAFRRTAALAA